MLHTASTGSPRTVRIDRARQPFMEVRRMEAVGLDAGVGEPADKTVADHGQGLFERPVSPD